MSARDRTIEGPADPAPASPTPRQWLALSVLVLAQLAVWLDNTILNVALKTLADPDEGLGATPNELQWSISSYTLVFAVLLFTGGVLADRYGQRRVLLIGLGVFGVCSAWAAWADSPGELILARAVMGVGSALIMPATLSLIAEVFDARHRAKAIAIWSGCSGLAIAAGPLLSGALLEHFWWGSVFLVNVPLVLVSVIGGYLLLPVARSLTRQRFDPVGVLLSTLGVLAVVYGVIEGGHRNEWLAWDVLGLIVLGLLLLVVFVLVELRIPHPSFDIRLFRNRRFTGASVAVMLTFFGLTGSQYYATFYLQGPRGQTPFEAGMTLAPVALGVLLGAPVSAVLVKRWGARLVVAGGMLIAAATFFGYVFFDTDTPLPWFWLLLVVQGLGLGASVAPTTEVIIAALPADRTGVGSAVNNSMRQIGGVLGVAVLGTVLVSVYRDRIGPDLAGLPPRVVEQAENSPEGARYMAEQAGLPQLVQAANDSFLHSMHVTTVIGGAMAVAGALIILFTFAGDLSRSPGADNDSEPAAEAHPHPDVHAHARAAGGGPGTVPKPTPPTDAQPPAAR
ncbi:DHA2 family efflux MFS transporter permease subunit [Streptomyces sp. NPDC005955]|uniref:MFS transporter n=1 Tax=Streptomyces sp. NPDC005955 TaxID=3364738 RepID=UPI0036D1E9B6